MQFSPTFHSSLVQIFSSAPCSQIPSVHILSLKRPSFTPIQNYRQNYNFVQFNFYVF
jgi:hypothetical protein